MPYRDSLSARGIPAVHCGGGRQVASPSSEGRQEDHEPPHSAPRGFPVARIGRGAVAHYVDNYRYHPGRTLCGRILSETTEVRARIDAPPCQVCVSVGRNYPTKAEFREYHQCTDCGVDTWTLGEDCYRVRDAVWRAAYPLYDAGVGVGSTRPCIGCLEKRLSRTLIAVDFIAPLATELGVGERLLRRLTDRQAERPPTTRSRIGRSVRRLLSRDRQRQQRI